MICAQEIRRFCVRFSFIARCERPRKAQQPPESHSNLLSCRQLHRQAQRASPPFGKSVRLVEEQLDQASGERDSFGEAGLSRRQAYVCTGFTREFTRPAMFAPCLPVDMEQVFLGSKQSPFSAQIKWITLSTARERTLQMPGFPWTWL